MLTPAFYIESFQFASFAWEVNNHRW